MKFAGPAFSLPVTEEEKENAEAVRSLFEDVLRKQDYLLDYLNVFFDQIDDLAVDRGLIKVSPLIKRYEQKLKKIFNIYIKSVSRALSKYESAFTDTELDDIRDLIIENVKNMRQETINLLILMKDVGSDNFVNDAKEAYSNILLISEKIEKLIRHEWFYHIDYDILGKIKLGSIPLSLK